MIIRLVITLRQKSEGCEEIKAREKRTTNLHPLIIIISINIIMTMIKMQMMLLM